MQSDADDARIIPTATQRHDSLGILYFNLAGSIAGVSRRGNMRVTAGWHSRHNSLPIT
jgi:hypothetical protein